MLQSFLPLFLMTFFICLFIVLMQFLWRYVDELVGKGLEVGVIAELFFYAALTMVPMALPLAILLASLMVFGNLGERFELTAMKASGISLVTTMRPLMALMVLVAIGAFFFQNNVLPVAQTKMWTLLYSMRQKSPEVEIPEGVFYDQLPGYNLFVEKKDRDTGMLYNMMIYDMSGGFDNARVILADSGRLSFTEDKTHLFIKLYDGEQFENLREQSQGGNMSRNVPYRRETFTNKEILVAFDANFNRMDESGMRNQYVGKNITELQATIDSVSLRVDSIGAAYGKYIKETPYMGLQYYDRKMVDRKVVNVRNPEVVLEKPLDVDAVFNDNTKGYARSYVTQAIATAKRTRQDYEYKSFTMKDDRKTIRRHGIEMHKKFTLSIACIIFFFIGAPLGAIIRKGGLGTPLVISVILFIIYYIIDNSGYKMARDGRLEVWEGMWLSTAILLPLGIFFTYKAVNDSAVFNRDAYLNFFRKILGLNETRHYEMKEVVMDELVPTEAVAMIDSLTVHCDAFLNRYNKRLSFLHYWQGGMDMDDLHAVSAELERAVDYMSNSRQRLVINKLADYPRLRSLFLYRPCRVKWIGLVCALILPVSLPVYLLGVKSQNNLKKELQTIKKVNKELQQLLLENRETV